MLSKTNGNITYSSFMHLTAAFSTLENELETFVLYLTSLIDQQTPASVYETDKLITLRKHILRQKIWCARYQKGIPAYLEECREWETFPDSFWKNINVQQNDPVISHNYVVDSNLSSALHSVLQTIEHTAKTAHECLCNYQHYGYIDHQPVAIDLLDYLIDIVGQLQDTVKQVQMIARKDFSTKKR